MSKNKYWLKVNLVITHHVFRTFSETLRERLRKKLSTVKNRPLNHVNEILLRSIRELRNRNSKLKDVVVVLKNGTHVHLSSFYKFSKYTIR